MSAKEKIDYEPLPNVNEEVSHKIRKEIVKYMRARKNAGFNYVSTVDIKRDVGISTGQGVGRYMRELIERERAERWSDGSPTTYRITIDD